MSSTPPDAIRPPSSGPERDPSRPTEGGLPSEEELEARARECFTQWGVIDLLAHIEVVWNRRLSTSAGRAHPRRLQIHLNPRLLARVPERVDEVLVHEAAHLATALLHPGSSHHGSEWANLMQQAGHEPKRTHDFPVEGLRRSRSYFLHLCSGCGERRIMDDARAPKSCDCDPALTDVFRAPRDKEGLSALNRHRVG